MNSRSKMPAADTETVFEKSLTTPNLSANAQTDHDGRKRCAVEKKDKSLKLLRVSMIQSLEKNPVNVRDTLRITTTQQTKVQTFSNPPEIFLSMMKNAASEPSKYQHSNAGSRIHDSVNVVDSRVERNYWSKSQE